uniref:Arylsulfatase n=1 Tax=Rhizochromulina marina TaxID=1034831 RepID=A0A7S2ST26_9STRA|mmetsp:Transcript_6995/g.20213  ORF Transcript_6995/g.20213 Transcript_6995/m.20213 type:complete len:244 (+) Transcript_6995:69-800(+)|eukprot:CAMPEP_0118966924 /NCGR_PEP_ID=MMETSP1173-20130426/4369_1 /TAXON_ID=1034831 /ORGANISM="Rhizochromulina marina cf, Strain CCMP1243" /LENGTH=243 /DNA_ID=CAMNT_0006915803 /DNA_START=62 /DNA_END=793 /DNA_ORIENTATION=-
MNGVRVAAIHAMQASNAPTAQAFKRVFPEACVLNLMDDALAKDVAVTGIDEAMHQRFEFLARYAKDHGKVEGVLFTCSAFGSAIEHVQRQLGSPAFPILKPNEAMQQEAVDLGGDIAVLSMFEPTLPSIEREMLDMARSQGKRDLKLHIKYIPGALEALNTGDEHKCETLIADATVNFISELQQQRTRVNGVSLAMFSMAFARERVQSALRMLSRESSEEGPVPVLTSPDSAVRKLRTLLSGT